MSLSQDLDDLIAIVGKVPKSGKKKDQIDNARRKILRQYACEHCNGSEEVPCEACCGDGNCRECDGSGACPYCEGNCTVPCEDCVEV